jgi:hypothetical protein
MCYYNRSFFHGTLHMWARIDEEHNYKEKNVYFSNMKKIIKHYPMTVYSNDNCAYFGF